MLKVLPAQPIPLLLKWAPIADTHQTKIAEQTK
jgi:hypothetical protein